MSAFNDTDRDRVLTWAIAQAQALSTPFVVYQDIRNRRWYCSLYPNLPKGEAINHSVRYVLPMGEVTRLS